MKPLHSPPIARELCENRTWLWRKPSGWVGCRKVRKTQWQSTICFESRNGENVLRADWTRKEYSANPVLCLLGSNGWDKGPTRRIMIWMQCSYGGPLDWLVRSQTTYVWVAKSYELPRCKLAMYNVERSLTILSVNCNPPRSQRKPCTCSQWLQNLAKTELYSLKNQQIESDGV